MEKERESRDCECVASITEQYEEKVPTGLSTACWRLLSNSFGRSVHSLFRVLGNHKPTPFQQLPLSLVVYKHGKVGTTWLTELSSPLFDFISGSGFHFWCSLTEQQYY
jgi:hypothetical protein